VPRADGAKGGRPAFDCVLMFKILLLQAMHGLSDERCEYLIKNRLSFMRFLGLGLADPVPDANTIWAFREALKRAGAVERLFAQFDSTLRAAGYLAMGGQIVDATIVAAPKQRNTEAERAAIKAGQILEGWAEKPAKLRQKDRDARWTGKFSKAKPREDGAPQVDLAVPAFGYKNHIGIDRGHGLIRNWTATHAAAHDGARLEEVLDPGNTASGVLVLQPLQLAGVRHFHPAVLRAPCVERRVADAVLAAQVRRRGTSLMLLEQPSNLLLREPRSLHRPSPVDGLYFKAGTFQGAGSPARQPRLQPDIGRRQRGATAKRDLEVGDAITIHIAFQQPTRETQLPGHTAKDGAANPGKALIAR
jgi:IS5 family transposase